MRLGVFIGWPHFIGVLSTIRALITNSLKKGKLMWSKYDVKAIEDIREKLIIIPVLRFLNFSKVFEVACDAWT